MKSGNRFGFILLLFIVGALIFMVFRPFAYAIAIAAIATAAVVGIFYAFQVLSRLYRKFRLRNSIEGIMEEKLERVSRQQRSIHDDLKVISKELSEVRDQLAETDLSAFAREKLLKLQEAFVNEQTLKQTKLRFYQMTVDRFNILLADHTILQTVASKKEQLKKISKRKLESDEPIDNLSEEKEIIEDLDYLFQRMTETEHLDEAFQIEKELVKMYQ